eukprot:1668000-Prymnesium_polylepis.1
MKPTGGAVTEPCTHTHGGEVESGTERSLFVFVLYCAAETPFLQRTVRKYTRRLRGVRGMLSHSTAG